MGMSAYRLMWMMVMFDLPVMLPEERKKAYRFRCDLEDMGFEMAQFSVYLRFCGSREQMEKYIKRVQTAIPEKGKVSMLFFTDKQFGQIINFYNCSKKKAQKQPDQLVLF